MALTRITQGVIKPNENYNTHNINSTGIITATGANISGNMSVGGVLTYEDVTNVDSVGLVTARSGIRIGGHILPTVNEAYDLGSADKKIRHLFLSDNSLKFVDSSDTEHPLSVDSGRLKFAGGMLLGNNIKMDAISGIVTATSFKLPDGSNVGGVESDSDQNTVGGTGAGQNLTGSSDQNTLFGYEAGNDIISGDYNTCIGHQAGEKLYDGDQNIAVGKNALAFEYSGDSNVAIGYNVLPNARSTNHNTSVGRASGRFLSSGDENILLGSGAGGSTTQSESLTSGSNNIIIGYEALPSATAVSNEITFGNLSSNHLRIPGIGVSFSAGGAVISGIVTATNFVKADGSSLGGVSSDSDGNTVGGTDAGSNLTTGTLYNTLFGYQAGQAIVPGSSGYHGDKNTFIGYEAGESVTTGYENVAIGYQAGNSFTTLPRSTLVGAEAGKGSTDGNDGVGYQCVGGAGGGASGYGNSGFGKYALARLTSGLHNTCVGAYAGNYTTDGDRNTIVGQNAGHMVNGNDNVIIGQDAAYDDNNSPFNTGSNCIIIGSHAMPTGQAVSNEITLGNASITNFRIPGLNITIDSNGISDAKGNLRSLPQNNTSGTYTLVAADAGKHVRATGQITIPSGTFSTGDMITIYNNSGSTITIVQGSSTTVYNSNDASTGNKTLKARGLCTILCESNNGFVASGNFE